MFFAIYRMTLTPRASRAGICVANASALRGLSVRVILVSDPSPVLATSGEMSVIWLLPRSSPVSVVRLGKGERSAQI